MAPTASPGHKPHQRTTRHSGATGEQLPAAPAAARRAPAQDTGPAGARETPHQEEGELARLLSDLSGTELRLQLHATTYVGYRKICRSQGSVFCLRFQTSLVVNK